MVTITAWSNDVVVATGGVRKGSVIVGHSALILQIIIAIAIIAIACYNHPTKADTIVKEGIAAHVAELKGHADLGPKPKSVLSISGEVYSAGGQTGEHPVFNHVNELQWQASLRGEPAPLQPTPAEQQAAERLGKPPPERPRRVYASGTLQGFGLNTFMTDEEVRQFFNPSEQKETKEDRQ